jgi:hypothetical protein
MENREWCKNIENGTYKRERLGMLEVEQGKSL